MANKQHHAGDLSRRDFIKTATVATAGVSAGVMPKPTQKSNPQVQTEWSITGREIQTLWTKIWPKIVALAWLNWVPLDENGNPILNEAGEPINTYRKEFGNNMAFRKNEVRRIASLLHVSYESQIPLITTAPKFFRISTEDYLENVNQYRLLYRDSDRPCSSDTYGETFFTLSEEGLVMPWPLEPDDTGPANIAYSLNGGTVPRPNPPWNNTESPERSLLERIRKEIDWNILQEDPPEEPRLSGLSGHGLFTLFDNWTRVIGRYWENPGLENKIMNHTKLYILPDVWTIWDNQLLQPVVRKNKDEIKFIYPNPISGSSARIQLELPLPTPHETTTSMFLELIVGHATNPMYTACY